MCTDLIDRYMIDRCVGVIDSWVDVINRHVYVDVIDRCVGVIDSCVLM